MHSKFDNFTNSTLWYYFHLASHITSSYLRLTSFRISTFTHNRTTTLRGYLVSLVFTLINDTQNCIIKCLCTLVIILPFCQLLFIITIGFVFVLIVMINNTIIILTMMSISDNDHNDTGADNCNDYDDNHVTIGNDIIVTTVTPMIIAQPKTNMRTIALIIFSHDHILTRNCKSYICFYIHVAYVCYHIESQMPKRWEKIFCTQNRYTIEPFCYCTEIIVMIFEEFHCNTQDMTTPHLAWNLEKKSLYIL